MVGHPPASRSVLRAAAVLAFVAATAGCQHAPSSGAGPVGAPATGTAGTGTPSSPVSTKPSVPPGGTDGSGIPAPAPTSRTTLLTEAVVPAPTATAAQVAEALRPARIAMPSISVDAAIADLGINPDGTIEVPRQPQQAGWLATSPAPGQRGPAVIAGHVDSTSGPAVFYPLRHIAVGDPIVVTRRDGSQVTFTVDGVQQFSKSDFPSRATYGPVPGPALRLITCDGPYDRSAGGYQDNLVVFAS